jgi:hypothetical protein
MSIQMNYIRFTLIVYMIVAIVRAGRAVWRKDNGWQKIVSGRWVLS